MKTLIDRVGETRTIKKVLEVRIEKLNKTIGEKRVDILRNISGFKTEEKMDVLLHTFKEMRTKKKEPSLQRF